MDDAFGRIVAIIFGAAILFYLPILCISLKMDNTTQAYVDNAVVEFVDNARATGIITDRAYEELCRKIDQVQPLCEVQIVHSSRYVTTDGEGGYDTFYFDYQKTDILDVIYTASGDNEPYNMKNGDFLQVIVYNRTPTLATKIYRFMMPLYNPSNVSIYTCYSGYVGNNPE